MTKRAYPKVSGFSILRHGERFGYPYLESLQSLYPFVDELIVNLDPGEDETEGKLLAFQKDHPKLRIMKHTWPLKDPVKLQSGQILSEETNLALQACSHDWCFYLQADEVLHEKDLQAFQDTLLQADQTPLIEAIVFPYTHFYGCYDIIQVSRSVYRREVRAFRKSSGAVSIGDAQSFKKPLGKKLLGLETKARIYHYGWVRPPETMHLKTFYFDQLYHGLPDAKAQETQRPHTGSNYQYKRFWGLRAFKGAHPACMQARIAATPRWNFKQSPFQFALGDIKKVLLDLFERWTSIRLFEYRPYKLAKPHESSPQSSS